MKVTAQDGGLPMKWRLFLFSMVLLASTASSSFWNDEEAQETCPQGKHLMCVVCEDYLCAKNAGCVFRGKDRICVCNPGYSSHNAWTTDCVNASKASLFADPHLTTWDGARMDWQGTCPLAFAWTITLEYTHPYYFEINIQSDQKFLDYEFSYIAQISISTRNIKILLNERTFVDQVAVSLPFFYPSRENWEISIRRENNAVIMERDDGMKVYFERLWHFWIELPQHAEYQTQYSFYGAAGDMNNDCTDDLIEKNGTRHRNPTCIYDNNNRTTNLFVASILDQYIFKNFPMWGTRKCFTGTEMIRDRPKCNGASAEKACRPIADARSGKGAFAACQLLRPEILEEEHANCMFDTCHGPPDTRCSLMTSFADRCKAQLLEASIRSWRVNLDCPLECGAHSHYDPEVSACSMTCAERKPPALCSRSPYEGCECDPGFLRDETTTPPTCVPKEKCPCIDEEGNSHREDVPFYSKTCDTLSMCYEGTIYSQPHTCPPGTVCGVHNGERVCHQ